MRSLGRLALLTEELSLKYSPIILEALGYLQEVDACQADSLALLQTEGPRQADGAHSRGRPNLEPGADVAAGAAAEEEEAEEAKAAAVEEGPEAAAKEEEVEAAAEEEEAAAAAEEKPGTLATMQGMTAPEVGPGAKPWRGGKKTEGSATEAAQAVIGSSGCVQAEQNGPKQSLDGDQALTAKQTASAACTAPLSSSGIAAATSTTLPFIQAASGEPPMPSASPTTAAAAAPLTQVQPPASQPAQAAASASAGATAAAPEAEALVLEAVSAAAAMVEAFPHLLEDVGEALASQLRCAIGKLYPTPPTTSILPPPQPPLPILKP